MRTLFVKYYSRQNDGRYFLPGLYLHFYGGICCSFVFTLQRRHEIHILYVRGSNFSQAVCCQD